jgi:formylglycine-generating enzyme required for sulfatase activity
VRAALAAPFLAGCLAPDVSVVAFACAADGDCASGRTCAFVAEAGEKRCVPLADAKGVCDHLLDDLAAGGCAGPEPCGLACVPGGTLAMGCDEATSPACAGHPEEGPAHLVTLAPFLVSAAEVTRADFAAFLSTDPAPEPPAASGRFFDESASPPVLVPGRAPGAWEPPPGEDDLPMVHVPWPAALAFCEARGETLCSEARWEAAARGTCEVHGEPCAESTPAYPWGAQPPACDRAVFADPGGACGGAGPEPTGPDARPAGASPFGARDLAGNVAEWTLDCWSDTHDGAPDDGTARLGACDARAVRGGAFDDPPESLRATAREPMDALATSASVGFRCCRVAP